jgi:hypothetical protein
MAFAGLLMICGPAAGASGSAHEQSSDQQGHPEAIFGTIDRIHAGEYSVKGDHGKDISFRITKDTNVICTSGKGTQLSTSREAVKDIPSNVPQQQGAQEKAADLERGSEFVAQSKEGCTFKAGDFVKIVASDMGTAEMIQKLARDKADSQ